MQLLELTALWLAAARAMAESTSTITEFHLEPRATYAPDFVGWSSSYTYGTSTDYETVECASGGTFTYSGNYWRCCKYTSCVMYTSCSGYYAMASGGLTSTYCSGADICSTDLLFASLGAKSPTSYIWCGTYTGDVYYRISPGQSVIDIITTTPYPSSITTTPKPGPTTTTSQTPSPTETSKPDHTAAIVGGTVGGVAAVLLAAGLGIFFFLNRRRNRNAPPPPAPAVAQVPPPSGMMSPLPPDYKGPPPMVSPIPPPQLAYNYQAYNPNQPMYAPVASGVPGYMSPPTGSPPPPASPSTQTGMPFTQVTNQPGWDLPEVSGESAQPKH